MNARDEYISRTNNAWQGDEDEQAASSRQVIPDGGRVTVQMIAMDSVQRQVASQAGRSQAADTRAALDALQRAADRTQAFADAFTTKRLQAEQIARDENPARCAYEQRMTNAWRQPANYAGEAAS